MKFILLSPIVGTASAFGVAGAFALLVLYSRSKKKTVVNIVKNEEEEYKKVVPQANYNQYGKLKDLESFGDYVVRQLELDSQSAIAKTVAKAAEAYLRDARNVTSESKEIACILVAGLTQEDENDKICCEILQELDTCVVAYFSFHWQHAKSVIEEVVSAGTTTNQFCRAVTRALRMPRYEKLLEVLRTKHRFSTLIELELRRKAGRCSANNPEEGVMMVHAESTKRRPVIVFVGGGAGAGKSTVVEHFLSSSFWSGVVHDAVKVDVDELIQTDLIYRQLARLSPHDRIGNAHLVQKHCTVAALSVLVSALNEGRDVVYDGTMSREPFVRQTMDMVRDIHNRWYRIGPGLQKHQDGTETIKYWEPLTDDDERAVGVKPKDGKRPYRIEFVGVVCDAHLAVVRGLRRAIATNRGVSIEFLLRSHKMFVKSLEKYISMVDAAKIFSTIEWNGPAELIAIKDGPGNKLLIDVDTYPGVRCLEDLNTNAGSVMELYKCHSDGRFVNQYWQNEILNPERKIRQERLRSAILDHATTSVLLVGSSSDASSDAEFASKERIGSDDDMPKGGPSSDDDLANID